MDIFRGSTYDKLWARTAMKLIFSIDEGLISGVEYGEDGNTTAVIKFENGKTLEWDDVEDEPEDSLRCQIGQDGLVMTEPARDHGFQARTETDQIKALIQADKEELADVCAWGRDKFGEDPFTVLSDYELEKTSGYWLYPGLSYLDPPPGKHYLLTRLYQEDGNPSVETEQEKALYRTKWQEVLTRDRMDEERNPQTAAVQAPSCIIAPSTTPTSSLTSAVLRCLRTFAKSDIIQATIDSL